jgi:hypothetical protein
MKDGKKMEMTERMMISKEGHMYDKSGKMMDMPM